MTALYAIHTEFLDDNGGNASISLAEPGGLATNDLLLTHLVNYNAPTVTVPGAITGFTDVIASYGTASGGAQQLARLQRRIADGSEGPTYTSTITGTSQYNDGAMLRLVESHPTTPIDGSNSTSGSATNANFPSVTTTAADCLAIAFVITPGTIPATPPTGWITLDLYGFGGNANAIYYKWMGAAGSSTGTSNLNWTTTGLYNIAVVTIAPATQTNPYLIGVGAQVVGTTTATPTYPTGYTAVADDLAIVHLGETIADTGEFTTPTNWTKAGTQLNEIGAQDIRCSVYYKKLTASESLPAWTGDTADGMSVQCQIWRGVDTTTAMDATAVPSESNAAGTFTPTGITTVTNNAVVVACVTTSDDNAINLSTPGNFGLLYGGVDYDTTTGADHADAAAARTQATAGSVTAPTFNQVLVGTDQWAAVVIALRPASTVQNINVPTATLTLSGIAPAVAGAGAATLAVPTGTLTLSGVVPTLVEGAVNIPIPVATLILSGLAPAIAGVGIASFTLPVATVTLSGVNIAIHLGHFPVAVSGNSRYLVDENGDPWFGAGDTGWSLVAQLSTADITTYLEDRAAKGVNLVLWNAIEHLFSDNAPNNDNNDSPFTGTAFQSAINDDYWDVVDHAVSESYRLGITCLICPAYLGFSGTEEGWDTEIVAATNGQMTTYGTSIGTRYAAWPNIIWLIGHDKNPSATEEAREAAMSDAIQAVTSHLVTVGGVEQLGSDAWESSGVDYDLDTVYFRNDNEAALHTQAGWAASPTMPTGFLEGRYENDGITNAMLRSLMYGPLVSGATYAIFGNNPIWLFGSGYAAEFNSQGSLDLERFAAFVVSLDEAWAAMVPDTTDTFLTSGEGTGATRSAARFDDTGATGVLAVVYRPHGGSATLTLDLTEFSAVTGVVVRKFDPTNAAYTTLGAFGTGSAQSFGSLGTNSDGDGDWILLVEAATNIEIPTAILTLSGIAPSVAPAGAAPVVIPTAVLTLSGIAPALTGTGVGGVAVPVGVLTLSGVAPTLAGSSVATLVVPPAILTLSGLSPDVDATGAALITIPTGVVTIQGVAPSVAAEGGPQFFAIPPATLTLSGVAPTLVGAGNVQFAISPAVLTLSGVPPAIAGAAVTIVIPVAVLTLSAVTPTVVGVGTAALAIPPATIVLSGLVPLVEVGAAGVVVVIPAAILTLTPVPLQLTGGGVATFNVPVAILTLIGVAVQVGGIDQIGDVILSVSSPDVVLVVDSARVVLSTSSVPAEYDVGDQPTVTGLFTDIDGNPADPTSILVRVRNPDGTTIDEYDETDLENPTVGTWTFTFPTPFTDDGPYIVKFYGTAGVIAADDIRLVVNCSEADL